MPRQWTESNTLSALFGKTRRAILVLLYSRPDESLYLRQIVRATSAGLGAVQRELKKLSDAGIIKREEHGVQAFYHANRDCPVFAELQGLVIKTAGVAEVLCAALALLADRIDCAFIYGSAARADLGPDSDIDVLVVGEVSFGDVVSALGPTQEKLNREVNPSVYPKAELCRKLRTGHHFLQNVLKEPRILLIGDTDEFAGLVKKRGAEEAQNHPTGNRGTTGCGNS